MFIEIISSTLQSIATGVISGLYAGLFIARYQRFADLRYQAKRIILEIEMVEDQGRIVFLKRDHAFDLTSIAEELIFLKHRKAAEALLKLAPEIYSSIQDAKMGRMDLAAIQRLHRSWQDSTRSISPNPFQLLHLWAGL